MENITCDIIQDLLPLYAEGEASADSQALVETHLESCPVCAAELEKLKTPLTIPAETEQRMLTQLRKKERRRAVRSVAVTAVAVLLVVALVEAMIVFLTTPDETLTFGASDLSVSVAEDGNTCLQFSEQAKGNSLLDAIYTQDSEGNTTLYVALENTTRLAKLGSRVNDWLTDGEEREEETLGPCEVTWTVSDDGSPELTYFYTSRVQTNDRVLLQDSVTAVYYLSGVTDETVSFTRYLKELFDQVWETASNAPDGMDEEQVSALFRSDYPVPDSGSGTLLWTRE